MEVGTEFDLQTHVSLPLPHITVISLAVEVLSEPQMPLPYAQRR